MVLNNRKKQKCNVTLPCHRSSKICLDLDNRLDRESHLHCSTKEERQGIRRFVLECNHVQESQLVNFFGFFFRHICRIAICRHPDSLLLFLDFGQGHNIFPSLTTYCSLQRNLITSLNFATMIVTTFYFFCTRNIEAIRNVLNKDIYYSYMQCLNGLLMG